MKKNVESKVLTHLSLEWFSRLGILARETVLCVLTHFKQNLTLMCIFTSQMLSQCVESKNFLKLIYDITRRGCRIMSR